MANRYNALSSHSVAMARKIAADASLCYQCSMPLGRCLHDVYKRLVGEPQYSQDVTDTTTYDQLRDLVAAAKQKQAERDTRGKNEEIRVPTSQLVWTDRHERR